MKYYSKPLKLLNNRVWRTYKGGGLINKFSGITNQKDKEKPEDWIGSIIKANNPVEIRKSNEGLSYVKFNSSKVFLKQLIKKNAKKLLGKKHFEKFGKNTALLVKLLNSAERLTIQVHPDKKTAKSLFDSNFGKTEAWYVLGGRKVREEPPYILLGFKPHINKKKWEEMFQNQNIKQMVNSLHKFYIKPGETFLIKGGIPHAIGPGCFLLEIQEPTDYTIRVEKENSSGEIIPDEICHQGIGFKKMFQCFNYNTYKREEVIDKWKLEESIIYESNLAQKQSLINYSQTSCFKMNLLEIDKYFEINKMFST